MIFSNARPGPVPYYRLVATVCLLFISIVSWHTARADDWQLGGHVKYDIYATHYDADNVFSDAGENSPIDHIVNLRVTAKSRWASNWDADIHYEAAAYHSDSVAVLRVIGLPPVYAGYAIPSDDARLFDLTSVGKGEGSGDGKTVLYHRLDRASVAYTTADTVFRFGRQAVSWGNGLVFQPMDIFNPFSPAAVDKEYKTGDDMLYIQYLLASGDDIQSVLIPRRDVTSGDLASDQSSLAIKYHAIRGANDMDILVSRHYADNLVAFGFASDWKGAVVRGDIVNAWTADGSTPSGVISLNYSWMWRAYNVSGYLEYYRNGVGISNEDYSPPALANEPELLDRLSRGEIFTLGRDYLAGGLTVEFSPRWLFNPLLINNINDGSWLTQWLASFDWKQNMTLLLGANIPVGGSGTEYGGLPTATPGVYDGGGRSVFLQLAYYF